MTQMIDLRRRGLLRGSGITVLSASAVAPTSCAQAILAALRTQVDPVFLPRRLRCVGELPRNETGKLPRELLAALLHGL